MAAQGATGVFVEMPLLEFLYKIYGQYKDNFIDHIPQGVSIVECKQALINEQESLHEQMDSLSYVKDVLLSSKGMKKLGIMVGLPALLAANPPYRWKPSRFYPIFLPEIESISWGAFLEKQFGEKLSKLYGDWY